MRPARATRSADRVTRGRMARQAAHARGAMRPGPRNARVARRGELVRRDGRVLLLQRKRAGVRLGPFLAENAVARGPYVDHSGKRPVESRSDEAQHRVAVLSRELGELRGHFEEFAKPEPCRSERKTCQLAKLATSFIFEARRLLAVDALLSGRRGYVTRDSSPTTLTRSSWRPSLRRPSSRTPHSRSCLSTCSRARCASRRAARTGS